MMRYCINEPLCMVMKKGVIIMKVSQKAIQSFANFCSTLDTEYLRKLMIYQTV